MPDVNQNWEYKTPHDILIACVGTNFGDKPEDNIETIRVDRGRRGTNIRHILGLRADERVADIGSGCGFVTRAIIPHVAHMWCIDISPDFLEYCRGELAEFSNVSYCLAKYAEFGGIESGSLGACYSTAVFIHFNYYDLIFYLTEVNRVLKMGGRFLFDFLNSDRMNYRKTETFQQHFKRYKANRSQKIFNVLHPMSLRTIECVGPQLGFEVSRVDYLPSHANDSVILRKVAATSP
jgi:cyclopropane fatty-acyl-phospholipid synthase-like methyltransferase